MPKSVPIPPQMPPPQMPPPQMQRFQPIVNFRPQPTFQEEVRKELIRNNSKLTFFVVIVSIGMAFAIISFIFSIASM